MAETQDFAMIAVTWTIMLQPVCKDVFLATKNLFARNALFIVIRQLCVKRCVL
jgi:hypothetical protein